MEEKRKESGYLNGLKQSYSDPHKKKKIWYVAVSIIVLLLIIPKIIPLFQEMSIFAEEEIAQVPQVDVVVLEAVQRDDKITATGNLRAIQEVELSTEVSGKVIGLHIEEGAEVERGQLLVKVNDNDLQAEKSRIESNISVMEETEARQQQLMERGGATQEVYDNTLMQLNNMRAEFASVQAQIERTEVRAPFDGVVGLTYISDGAYVTPSSRIASLQDMSSVRIDFSIPERYSANVSAGNEIRFQVQGVDSVFTGRVTATEPQIDPRTRTLQVRAVSDNPDGLLNPGAYANVELILTTYEDALMLPSVALIPDAGQYKVLTYSDGSVTEKYVTTGTRTRNSVHILEGLAPGDTVLVSGLLQVNDGSEVEIRNRESLADNE
ncbi:MAG: efflux RND transporter periplasmic adaptor subunit [Balneolaceae bacterium]|nr:efflux RND transporter periplasmic adaptor subunit [Balneolaceae bacterium]